MSGEGEGEGEGLQTCVWEQPASQVSGFVCVRKL